MTSPTLYLWLLPDMRLTFQTLWSAVPLNILSYPCAPLVLLYHAAQMHSSGLPICSVIMLCLYTLHEIISIHTGYIFTFLLLFFLYY
jgi:hypothetical protein